MRCRSILACTLAGEGPTDVVKTEKEWRQLLSRTEYLILRKKSTEPAFSGKYDKFFPQFGHFKCRGCASPLYSVRSKFDSRSGWPAFDQCYVGAVRTKLDLKRGLKKEVLCRRCGGHLGHVFHGECLTVTNERHCINSVALVYDSIPHFAEETCVKSCAVE